MAKLAGRYQVLKELGRGGFGVTYLAEDHHQPSHPKCVVKQLQPQPPPPPALMPKVRELFEKEAVTLERLGKHPQIPQLLAHFEEQGNFYIVQEFIEGQTLREELETVKTLSEKAVVQLLQEGLEILSFVHQQGVIHRDIKPENLMRQRDGNLFLIDFGAVKAFTATAMPQTKNLTTTVTIGTPGYMPDEQQRGRPLPASDVYALGMVAIEALTGKSPINLGTDPNTGEVVWRQGVQIEKGLTEVLIQMVRHHYSRRYANGAAALVALELAMQPQSPRTRPLPTPHQSPQPMTSSPRTRRRMLQWMGYGILAAAGAVTWEQRGLLARLWTSSLETTGSSEPPSAPIQEATPVEVVNTEAVITSLKVGDILQIQPLPTNIQSESNALTLVAQIPNSDIKIEFPEIGTLISGAKVEVRRRTKTPDNNIWAWLRVCSINSGAEGNSLSPSLALPGREGWILEKVLYDTAKLINVFGSICDV